MDEEKKPTLYSSLYSKITQLFYSQNEPNITLKENDAEISSNSDNEEKQISLLSEKMGYLSSIIKGNKNLRFQQTGAENVPVQCKLCGIIFCHASQFINATRKRLLIRDNKKEVIRHSCQFCDKIFRIKFKVEKHILQHIIGKQIMCMNCLFPTDKFPQNNSSVFLDCKISPSALLAVHCGKCKHLFCRGDQVIEKYLSEDIRKLEEKSKIFDWKCGICQSPLHPEEDQTVLNIMEHLWVHMINNELFCDKCRNID